jgi:hypothetical protein
MRIPALLTIAALCLLAQPVDIHKRLTALEYASRDADDVAGVVAELRVEVAGLKGAVDMTNKLMGGVILGMLGMIAKDLLGRKS